MSKQIEFEYEDKKYVLEYSREAIKVMESNGFDINEYNKKPMLMIDLAFQGAFIKNHRNVKLAVITEIFEKIKDKEDLNITLLEMITETYNSLFENNTDDSKNIDWKIV